MKKLLVLAAVLCCTFGLFAKIGDPTPEIIQLTFGLGAADLDNDSNNQLGLTVGADIDWNVWEKATSHAHDGSGKMYAGLDLAAQWWMPTEHGFDHHMIMIPVQGNFMYLFDTTQMKGAGPLTAVGPWLSMGVGLNVFAWDDDAEFAASFAWGLGAQLNFNNSWGLKAGFGGNAGGDKWFHNSHDYFMAEATYRF
ncbi:hypothetical protein II898_03760 [bacterium]|nr:hypothetical protein [bacterium]